MLVLENHKSERERISVCLSLTLIIFSVLRRVKKPSWDGTLRL